MRLRSACGVALVNPDLACRSVLTAIRGLQATGSEMCGQALWAKASTCAVCGLLSCCKFHYGFNQRSLTSKMTTSPCKTGRGREREREGGREGGRERERETADNLRLPVTSLLLKPRRRKRETADVEHAPWGDLPPGGHVHRKKEEDCRCHRFFVMACQSRWKQCATWQVPLPQTQYFRELINSTA